MSAPSTDALDDAARRVEGWLLRSGVQLTDGPQRGGVAGWLDAKGNPQFVYLEITGYHLATMAWLIAGGARTPEGGDLARERGRRSLAWMHGALADGALPATRLYLAGDPGDWRNDATFSFDLAMAARGVACYAAATGGEDRTAAAVLEILAARLTELFGSSPEVPSHRALDGARLPERWSTSPGPHHLKVAAAILRLPGGTVGEPVIGACQATMRRWVTAMGGAWPCSELHALLYGLEGIVLEPGGADDGVAAAALVRLMELQGPDGSLPAETSGPTTRADVLAQALRLGALLRTGGQRDALAGALLAHVRADGSVRFASDQELANAWCAMFAHQALVLHAHSEMAAAGRENLV